MYNKRKKFIRITAAACAAFITLTFSSCAAVKGENGGSSPADSGGISTSAPSVDAEPQDIAIPSIELNDDGVLTAGDVVGDEILSSAGIDGDKAVYIYMNGSSVQSGGGGVVCSDGVLTIGAGGVYILSGSFDGQLHVNADKNADVVIALYNASITCESSSAIYVEKANSCAVVTLPDTVNTLRDGSEYVFADEADPEPDATLYSKCDLRLGGAGELYVYGSYGDAVTGRDELTIDGGVYFIEAADDGVNGRDRLSITGGELTVVSAGDSLKSSNETDEGCGQVLISGGVISLKAEGDGIDAARSVELSGGSVYAVTGGGSYESSSQNGFGMPGGGNFGSFGGETTETSEDEISRKGIKAGEALAVTGGTLTLSCYDDALHSNGSIVISGGTQTLASGDDGIHADGDIFISGCELAITQSLEGIEGVTLTIESGSVSVTASDDGINVSDGSGDAGGMFGGFRGFGTASETAESTTLYLKITGGTVYINSGGDGLDSNGSIIQSGGYVMVDGPTNSGNGAIDYATGYTVTGGTLIAAGASGMAETPSAAENQAVVSLNINGEAGTKVALFNEAGAEILSFTTAKAFGNAVISSPDIQVGETYSYTVNGEAAGEIEVTLAITGASGGMGGGFGGGFGGGGGSFGFGGGGRRP